MNIANKIKEKLNKILEKLKSLGVVQAFKLEIEFCHIEKNLKGSLLEIDSILKKCVKKIISKPKKAEIRKIISELVRKKNLNDVVVAQEPVELSEKKSLSVDYSCSDNAAVASVLKFECSFCNEVFNSEKNFSAHEKIHKYSKVYLCDRCGKIFYNFKIWQKHMEDHSEQNGNIKYFENELLNDKGECFVNVLLKQPSSDSLKKSIPINKSEDSHVAPKKETQFTCSCGKVFNILKTFRKHERLKHSSENTKYNCITCGKSFLEKGKLNRHMLSHKESQYQCSLCSKQFSRSDTLKRHISLFHCTSREFLCSFCHKKFKLKFNRDVHEENIHKNIDNWIKCQHCGQKFRNKITLKSHLKIHSGNKITCNKCGKTFTRKSHYKSHMESKHSGGVTY